MYSPLSSTASALTPENVPTPPAAAQAPRAAAVDTDTPLPPSTSGQTSRPETTMGCTTLIDRTPSMRCRRSGRGRCPRPSLPLGRRSRRRRKPPPAAPSTPRRRYLRPQRGRPRRTRRHRRCPRRCLVDRPHAELDLAAIVDRQHLHLHHVAFLDDIGNLADALVTPARRCGRARHAAQQVHEGAEIDHAAPPCPHRSAPTSGLAVRPRIQSTARWAGSASADGDLDRAVVLDVDLGAGLSRRSRGSSCRRRRSRRGSCRGGS